jgi:hypothetical protein
MSCIDSTYSFFVLKSRRKAKLAGAVALGWRFSRPLIGDEKGVFGYLLKRVCTFVFAGGAQLSVSRGTVETRWHGECFKGRRHHVV